MRRSRAPRGRNWARTSAHGLRELRWCLPVDSALLAARASWSTTWGVAASSWSLWQTWYWQVQFLSGPPSSSDHGSLGEAGTMPSSCASLRLLLEEFPVPCARAVRTLNLVHYFPCPCFLAVIVPGVWVLLMSTNFGFFGRRLSSWEQCLVLQWIHALRQYFGDYGRTSHMFLRCGILES